MTLPELVDTIEQKARKYATEYYIAPVDVCLGPDEFRLLYEEARQAGGTPEWHHRLSEHFWYRGMRVRLLQNSGVFVGNLV